jgi:hypothetical protein
MEAARLVGVEASPLAERLWMVLREKLSGAFLRVFP